MIEKYLAENLITIIGNQAVQIAQLQTENENLKQRNSQLQEIVNNLRKKVKMYESGTDQASD